MELAEVVEQAVPGCGARVYNCASGEVLVVDAAAITEVMTFLRDDAEHSFDMLVDVTAADHTLEQGCIHVVYQLRSIERNTRLMVKTMVESAAPSLASISGLWHSANWAEREVWDMFGVRFQGHPNLRRILMYEEFEGHPLLKSYPVDKRQPLVDERDPIANPWPSRDRY